MKERPLLIWLALIYLAVTFLLNAFVVVSNIGYFFADAQGIISLVINLAFCVLVVATFHAILFRSKTGRNFAVKSFAILGFFGIYNSVALLQISSFENILIPVLIVTFRILAAVLVSVYFAISDEAKRYFLAYSTD